MDIKRITVVLGLSIGMMFSMSAVLYASGNFGESQIEEYDMYSGLHSGVGDEYYLAYDDVVYVPEAYWLRLCFADCNLGQSSYVKMISAKDGATQHLNAESMATYRNSSAFFNGDEVQIELYVSPEDSDVFFQMEGIGVGRPDDSGGIGVGGVTSLCGSDNRTSVIDPAVGRLWWAGAGGCDSAACTAFITMKGVLLGCKHCYIPSCDFIEFNVPSSLSNGVAQHPAPSEQYVVSIAALGDGDDEDCQDYALIWATANSETGLTPLERQRAFCRLYNYEPTSVRITGYGADETPSGTGGPPICGNSDNFTLQSDWGSLTDSDTHADPTSGRIGTVLKYVVDTSGGSSGSPVKMVSGGPGNVAIGIHTQGGCDRAEYGYRNAGTGFNNTWLRNNVNSVIPANTVYADNDHPSSVQDGTVWNPYDTVGLAVGSVTPGWTVTVAGGSYDEPMTINKALTITAAGGTVTIGQ